MESTENQKRVSKGESARRNIDRVPVNGDLDETSKINTFENKVKEPRISAGAYALRAIQVDQGLPTTPYI